MQLKQLGSNQTLIINDNVMILFSYETPVAAFIGGEGFYKTSQYYSKTTTKHINTWLRSENLDPKGVTEKPAEFFANLLPTPVNHVA